MVSETAFYDSFAADLLAGWQASDPRVRLAAMFAAQFIEPGDRVLDAGCGIGWGSWLVASECGCDLLGVDSSPAMIEQAQLHFEGEHGGGSCRFRVGDILRLRTRAFDAVLLLDVYEHFPRGARDRLHRRLAALSSRVLCLTAPTPSALAQLRAQGVPLQPIDENVWRKDLEQLAGDLGGDLFAEVLEIGGLEYWHAAVLRCQ